MNVDKDAFCKAIKDQLDKECTYAWCECGADGIGRIAQAAISFMLDGFRASQEALVAEHSRLRGQYAELMSRYEALHRDCHGDYSATPRHPAAGEVLPIEPSFVVVRVPRSGDMQDVVDACRSAQPGI